MVKENGLFFKVLGAFLALVLIASPLEKAFAVQWAVVKAEKAVIFADPDQSAPIGVVKAGKRIKVGSTPLKNGAVLPVVVSGRVAYVRTEDLHLNEFKVDVTTPKQIKEHQYYDVEEQELVGSDLKSTFLTLSAHKMGAGDEWAQLSTDLGGAGTEGDVSSFLLMAEYRHPIKPYMVGLGLGYYSIEGAELMFKTLTVEFTFHYSLINTSLLAVGVGGGVFGSGNAALKVVGGDEYKSPFYGTILSARAHLFPRAKLGAHMGLGVRQMRLTDMESIRAPGVEEDAEGAVLHKLGKLGGAEAYFGVSYRF